MIVLSDAQEIYQKQFANISVWEDKFRIKFKIKKIYEQKYIKKCKKMRMNRKKELKKVWYYYQ